jgi:hypothetical protein
VDVFATKDGVPVEDLKAGDFEVAEDNTPQKVETFEHVKIEGGGDPVTRVEPRTVRESREMAADPRARVSSTRITSTRGRRTPSGGRSPTCSTG